MTVLRARLRLRSIRELACEDSGISVVEFAIIAPTFLMMLLAVFDLGFLVYARAVLQGAVEEGARTASLENTQWSTIKDRVNAQLEAVLPVSDTETDIQFELDPVYYASYNDIELPEDFTDTNNDGTWDPEECFVDRNGNANYDTDVGLEGRGGAQDVVSLEASVTYKRIFPLWGFLNQPQTHTVSAATFLRNQPFSAQASRVGVQICPAP
jgi:hypothetical protein